MEIIYYLLLSLSVALAVSKSSLYNAYAKRTDSTLFTTFGFNATCYGVAAIIALVVLAFGFSGLSLSTLICAFFYAAIVFSLQTVSIVAMRVGAMSTTAICVMYGLIIPSLAGPIFWKESFSLLQAIGIVIMLVSLGLLHDGGDSKDKPASKKFLILAVVAFLLSGMAGVMEKIHQSTDGKEEKAMFVFIACLFMLLFSLVGALSTRKKGERIVDRSLLVFGPALGVVIGLYSITNLTLAGGLDAMIYYPVSSGGAMLLTVLVSCFVFGEAFNTKKIVGTTLGIIGIVCLSLPI